MTGTADAEWIRASVEAHGRTLTGLHAHYCPEWSDLPVDDTTKEWPCGCFEIAAGVPVEKYDDDEVV